MRANNSGTDLKVMSIAAVVSKYKISLNKLDLGQRTCNVKHIFAPMQGYASHSTLQRYASTVSMSCIGPVCCVLTLLLQCVKIESWNFIGTRQRRQKISGSTGYHFLRPRKYSLILCISLFWMSVLIIWRSVG